jgi:hypothetical protein
VISGPIPILFFCHEVAPVLVLIGVVLRVGLAELTVRKRPSSVGGMILHALLAPGSGSQRQPAHVHQLHAHLLVSGRLAGSSTVALAPLAAYSYPPASAPLARHLLDRIPHPSPHLLHVAAPRQPPPPAFPRVLSPPGSPRASPVFPTVVKRVCYTSTISIVSPRKTCEYEIMDRFH